MPADTHGGWRTLSSTLVPVEVFIVKRVSHVCFLVCLVLVEMGSELRAMYLLGRHCNPESRAPSPPLFA
jgi:hypothetical protein